MMHDQKKICDNLVECFYLEKLERDQLKTADSQSDCRSWNVTVAVSTFEMAIAMSIVDDPRPVQIDSRKKEREKKIVSRFYCDCFRRRFLLPSVCHAFFDAASIRSRLIFNRIGRRQRMRTIDVITRTDVNHVFDSEMFTVFVWRVELSLEKVVSAGVWCRRVFAFCHPSARPTPIELKLADGMQIQQPS